MLISINAPERFHIEGFEGFYLIPTFDPDTIVQNAIGRDLDFKEKFFHYGVADNALNIIEHHPELNASDNRKFVVFMTEVRREDEPMLDGWRWDKWGEYIGTQNPQHEYLAFEDNIDSVFVYHIFWLKK